MKSNGSNEINEIKGFKIHLIRSMGSNCDHSKHSRDTI